jgi:hypothetical protein
VRFGLPQLIGGQIRSIVPWSRILSSQEVVAAINTDYNQPLTVWVTLDNALHQSGDLLKCLYSTNAQQIAQTTPVELKNGKAVLITVPPAGLVIYQ